MSDATDPIINTYVVTLGDAQQGENVVIARVPEDQGHEVSPLRFVREGEKKVLSHEVELTRRQASHLYGFDVKRKKGSDVKKPPAKETPARASSPSPAASSSATSSTTASAPKE